MNATTLRKRLGRQKGECTWCGKPVPKGRRRWCGDDCVAAFKETHDWQYIRQRVYDRDQGICTLCNFDAEKVQRIAHAVRYQRYDPREIGNGFAAFRHLREFYRQFGYHGLLVQDLWEADHIKPQIEGGGHELDNLRTLCVACHKIETARLAARLAKTRKPK